MEKFGWCFIGSGGITQRVVKDLPRTNGAYVASVWSRNFENAEKFAAAQGAKAYKTVEEAVDDPYVKAVYVATVHPVHKEYVLRALKMGKPVLCEKPLAMNLEEAKEMVETAQKNKVYLLDGLWTRHNPAVKQAVDWVKAGKIGKVHALSASFCFFNAFDPKSRLHAPELGGGALLDVGVYVIAMARFFLETMPTQVSSAADFSPLGIDNTCAMQFKYADGVIARLFCSITTTEPQDGIISGENGHIIIPKFWAPRSTQLITESGTENFEADFEGEGFQFEFDAAMSDILADKKENPLVNHRMSLDIMGLIDQVMNQITKK